MSPGNGWKWKWPDGVEKSEMDLFWCISMTNNLKSSITSFCLGLLWYFIVPPLTRSASNWTKAQSCWWKKFDEIGRHWSIRHLGTRSVATGNPSNYVIILSQMSNLSNEDKNLHGWWGRFGNTQGWDCSRMIREAESDQVYPLHGFYPSDQLFHHCHPLVFIVLT